MQRVLIQRGRGLLLGSPPRRSFHTETQREQRREGALVGVCREADRLRWYTCGPTVYDHGHIGHARNYITVDILHRILENHFNVAVDHVLGMTDIDDKIIIKATQTQQSPQAVAQFYEQDFFSDMDALRVKRPMAVTRVTEHIPEIIQFVEKILQNGYAYVAPSGSVYFDSSAYRDYPKFIDTPNSSDEEQDFAKEKKQPSDFALWKAAKVGEPFWTSPWGNGRPGWHIECSAMCTHIFGRTVDVHSGGVDLKFPHHQNEVAQCHAHFNIHPSESNWVNTFIHIGHVHIEGRKMSKSLKNFITIKDFLKDYSTNHLRVFCAQTKYSKNIDFSSAAMVGAVQIEARLKEFELNLLSKLKQLPITSPKKWTSKEIALHQSLLDTKLNVVKSFADDFDTTNALASLMNLVSTTNTYLQQVATPPSELLLTIHSFFKKVMNDTIGVSFDHLTQGNERNQEYSQIVDALVEFRAIVKESTRTQEGETNLKQALLVETDKLRNKLKLLGIKVEDQRDGKAVWKPIDTKSSQILEQQKEKAETTTSTNKKERASIPPSVYFKETASGQYSAFDEQGLPTHDAQGNPLSKNKTKKLQKDFEKQQKLFDQQSQKQ